jgi:hypothetical protein
MCNLALPGVAADFGVDEARRVKRRDTGDHHNREKLIALARR